MSRFGTENLNKTSHVVCVRAGGRACARVTSVSNLAVLIE